MGADPRRCCSSRRRCPTPGSRNLLWQAALGAWPISADRLHAYAEKAMREAGDRTTWTDPDEDYESAVHAAIDAVIDEPEACAPLLDGLVAELAPAARSNSLALKLLALTMPGVPDVYQGSEVEERSLVDPDNRRPVDFDAAMRPASRRRRRSTKQRLTRDGAAAATRPSGAVHRLHRRSSPTVRPPTTCSPSTAAVRSPSSPGCRSGSRPRRAGATPRSTLPEGRVDATCLGRWLDTPRRSLRDRPGCRACSADLPVALLVREG